MVQAEVHATSQTTRNLKAATSKENEKKKRPQVIQAEVHATSQTTGIVKNAATEENEKKRQLQELQAKLIISQETEELTNVTTKDIESSKSMRSNTKQRSKQNMCLKWNVAV